MRAHLERSRVLNSRSFSELFLLGLRAKTFSKFSFIAFVITGGAGGLEGSVRATESGLGGGVNKAHRRVFEMVNRCHSSRFGKINWNWSVSSRFGGSGSEGSTEVLAAGAEASPRVMVKETLQVGIFSG